MKTRILKVEMICNNCGYSSQYEIEVIEIQNRNEETYVELRNECPICNKETLKISKTLLE